MGEEGVEKVAEVPVFRKRVDVLRYVAEEVQYLCAQPRQVLHKTNIRD